jgi:hypothetical protein
MELTTLIAQREAEIDKLVFDFSDGGTARCYIAGTNIVVPYPNEYIKDINRTTIRMILEAVDKNMEGAKEDIYAPDDFTRKGHNEALTTQRAFIQEALNEIMK